MASKAKAASRDIAKVKASIEKARLSASGCTFQYHFDALALLNRLFGETSSLIFGPSEVGNALSEYITMKTVALLQSATRTFLAEYIEAREKAGMDMPEMEILSNLEWLRILRNKEVTLGEFIAHNLPANSWEQIQQVIKDVTKRSFEEHLANNPKYVPKGYLQTLHQDMAALYEQRNIVCHELTALTKPLVETHLAWGNAVLCVLSVYSDVLYDVSVSSKKAHQ